MKKLMLIVSVMLLCGVANAGILPLVNGSFEDGVPAAWSTASFNGWVNATTTNNICLAGGSPTGGSKYLLMDVPSVSATGQLNKYTGYVIQSGSTYTVSADIFETTAAVKTFLLAICAVGNGGALTQVAGTGFTSSLDGKWHTKTVSYTADSAQAGKTLMFYTAFQRGGSTSRYGYLDNAQLSVVPEPATIAVLLTGMAGMLLKKRRNA